MEAKIVFRVRLSKRIVETLLKSPLGPQSETITFNKIAMRKSIDLSNPFYLNVFISKTRSR